MAYSQTTASSLTDVITQIIGYAIANAGFTDEGSATYGGHTKYRMSKNGLYWTFYTDYTSGYYRIRVRMSYSISDIAAPTSANSQWDWTIMSAWIYGGPYPNLYMYSDGLTVHSCLEVTTGIFTHLSIGSITKTDTFTGGEYCAGNYYERTYNSGGQNYFYWDDSYGSPLFSGGWHSRSHTSLLSYIRSVKPTGATNNEADFAAFSYHRNDQHAQGVFISGPCDYLMRDAPNTATLRTPLFPCYIFIRDQTTGLYRSSGYVEGLRLVQMEYLNPAEIILNNWQVFPLIRQEGNSIGSPVSGTWGVAYKRA